MLLNIKGIIAKSVDKLEIVSHANGNGVRSRKEAVVVAFSSAYPAAEAPVFRA